MNDIVSSPPNISQSKNSFIIYISIVLAILILILLTGAVLATRLMGKKNSDTNTITVKKLPTPTIDQLPIQAKLIDISSKSNKFIDSIDQLLFEDALIQYIQKNPKFALSGTIINTRMALSNLKFQSLTVAEAKIEYKNYLKNIAEENKKGLLEKKEATDVVIGNFLAQIFYMARIGSSPFVTVENRALWKKSIMDGREVVEGVADIQPNKKEEMKKYINDFFKQKEFTFYGL